jgi:hypothetical protein
LALRAWSSLIRNAQDSHNGTPCSIDIVGSNSTPLPELKQLSMP